MNGSERGVNETRFEPTGQNAAAAHARGAASAIVVRSGLVACGPGGDVVALAANADDEPLVAQRRQGVRGRAVGDALLLCQAEAGSSPWSMRIHRA